ncbi:hypothetical protein M011DRAFT_165351 [Sporormia fimetaria CBS 119925]|uniref:Uncharacterized protein n=1 Tax=Sporormia fimetaria CBS 119925 TaxID=1340428 RepID=A0A6A6V4P6_9PLEO|nr:hypothetical protein M011DRAFT_165351 [Sporormia fimetaria CBS 119925]
MRLEPDRAYDWQYGHAPDPLNDSTLRTFLERFTLRRSCVESLGVGDNHFQLGTLLSSLKALTWEWVDHELGDWTDGTFFFRNLIRNLSLQEQSTLEYLRIRDFLFFRPGSWEGWSMSPILLSELRHLDVGPVFLSDSLRNINSGTVAGVLTPALETLQVQYSG